MKHYTCMACYIFHVRYKIEEMNHLKTVESHLRGFLESSLDLRLLVPISDAEQWELPAVGILSRRVKSHIWHGGVIADEGKWVMVGERVKVSVGTSTFSVHRIVWWILWRSWNGEGSQGADLNHVAWQQTLHRCNDSSTWVSMVKILVPQFEMIPRKYQL